jgi:hypothetical protein
MCLCFAVLLPVLGGCAVVDSSVPGRLGAVDRDYDTAGNREVLLNIVRASHLQPLRFYTHSKMAPSQTSDFKLGLPSITFGPAKAAAAKEFAFSGSLLDNSASISSEVDPIETKDFHNYLLTPISVGQIGVLIQNFPRELVYFLVFDSMRVTEDGKVYVFKNDPANEPTSCPDFDYSNYDRAAYKATAESISREGREGIAPGVQLPQVPALCRGGD